MRSPPSSVWKSIHSPERAYGLAPGIQPRSSCAAMAGLRYLQGKPGPPIGAGDIRPIEHALLLGPGDRLVMFTDGLFERRGVDLDIGLTHLMITTEQTLGNSEVSSACEFILREMLSGAHDDDVCLLIADFSTA